MAKKKEKADEEFKKSVNLLQIAEKTIEKKYGKGIISSLGDHSDLIIDAISTGCLSLDAATGIGGFARGRVYEVFGPNSSGKSTLALSVVMQALLRQMTIVYIDAEHALDPKLVRNMGNAVNVDVDQIKLVQAYTGDDNLQIAEELIKTDEVDVVVVDSISALLPSAMAEGEIGDNYIGQLARLMSKACNKLTPIVNRTNTLLIFVNQTRHDIGKWGDSRVPTGGEAVPFYATGRIKVEGGESKNSRILNDDGVVIGHECNFLVIKNKLAAPWRSANINLIYGQGYDFVSEIVNLSIDFGFIEQSGAWFEVAGERVQGKKNLVDMFRERTELYTDYRSRCMTMLGLKYE
jgi:recombination protein RecA